jgi:hypothetical protein
MLLLVGATVFETATPCSQSRCSTRLSYAPTFPMLCRVAAARSSVVASGQGFLADLLRCGLLIGANQRVADLVAGSNAEPRGRAACNFQHPANQPL